MDKRTKFTPGPWRVYDAREDDNSAYDYVVLGANDIVLADVCYDGLVAEEANAYAIAAVPDLYACLLEACAEMCHNLSEDTGYCRYLDREAMLCRQLDGECFVQKWIKALAKARGEVRE